MEKRIKERAKKALKELEISVNELANFRQLTRSTINDQFNGNSKIGAAALEALLAYCPQLSAEWLLRGAGDMLISSVVPTEGTPRDDRENSEQMTKDEKIVQADARKEPRMNQGTTNEVVALLNKQIEQLEYIVELQKDRILQLEKECEDLKKANSTATTSHATTA